MLQLVFFTKPYLQNLFGIFTDSYGNKGYVKSIPTTKKKIKGNFNEDENIKVLQLSPRKVFELLLKNKIHSVNTIIALEWFKDYFKSNK